MTQRSNDDAPFFVFQGDLRAVPDGPTHCVKCRVTPLEPLRRYAGLCRSCVTRRSSAELTAARPFEARFELVGEHRRTIGGKTERYVQVRCSCGSRRTMKWDTWTHHRPACCKRCRLRAVDAHGFEPEFSR